jgi:hypothetical protein
MFVWPCCIVTNFFIIKPTTWTNFTNLFWHETVNVSDSLSPSSGVYSLYTQQWCMPYRLVDSFRAGPGPARKLSTRRCHWPGNWCSLCTTRVWTWGEPHFEMIFVVVFVDVYCCLWFCTHGTIETCSPVVCLEICICYNVKSWHSVLVLQYL